MSNFLTSGASTRAAGAVLLALAVLAAGCRDLINVGDDDGIACQATLQCPSGQVCVAGHCGVPGNSAEGDSCWASRECRAGLYCSQLGVCAPAGSGVVGDTCGSDADCEAGLRCDLHGLAGSCAAGGNGEPGFFCEGNLECLPGLYCAPDSHCKSLIDGYPPYVGVTCPPLGPNETFRAYFEVPRPGAPPADFYRLPFPNDVRVAADGTLDMSDFPDPGPTPLGVDLVKLYVDALKADFEGFGSTSLVTFRFANHVDFATTQLAGAVSFVDVTPGPSAGQSLAVNWGYASARTKYSCENRLSVRNNIYSPLLPHHTYAVLLSTAIKSDTGVAAVQDPDLVAVLAATRPTSDAALGHAWDTYQPLRTYLAGAGIAPATIADAAVFTVQDTTGHMQRLAASVAAQPAPVLSDLKLCDTGVVSTCDDGTPERACPAADADFYELHGKISMPIYQIGAPPYLTEGGGIGEDAAGAPLLVRTEDVCFALTIPKAATMPAGGWPLVVYSHGTGGSMRSFISDGVAKQLATGTTPAAVFGFDAVEHGARRGDSQESPNNLVFNVLNPHAARDNLLQGAADILQALRVAALPAFAAPAPGPATIQFDATKVGYFGHSQGSSSGELALAFSNAAPAAVFSGAGAFLTTSLQEKTSPVNIKAGMTFLLGDEFNGEHPVMTLFQTYFERSDAINYAPLIVRAPPAGVTAKHVFMSYGASDTFTPRGTLSHNARGLGLAPVAPVLPDEDYGTPAITRPISANLNGHTAACFMYAPDGYDGHFVATKNPAAVADWTAFLKSFFATGVPRVP